MSRRGRLVLGGLGTLALVLPLVWMWWSSLLPSSYSVMEMGYLDRGGAPAPASATESDGAGGHAAHGGAGAGGTVSVAELATDPGRAPDVVIELVARQERFTLASGREVQGYTVNGRSPGPRITVRVGQLVEVRLHNESVAGGMTLHWHGVDVPNAEDGVAGVTQDAVGPGEDFTYRWVAPHVGTYWYHSHQVSHEQVAAGLLGALVVLPRHPADDPARDVVAVSHLYDGVHTVNGLEGDQRVPAPPGSTVRVRVVNTDNGPLGVWSDTAYRVLAHDGYDVRGPTPVEQELTDVPAGGRVDVEVRVPDAGTAVRLQLGAATALVVGPGAAETSTGPVPQPRDRLDLLTYGRSGPPPVDAAHPDREFTYSIGRRPGFVDGRPGMWWSVNGHLYPDLPMFVVRRGDVVVVHLENHSGDVHPMHLHGHHAVVLARDGAPATGSPWWFDSLDVRDGESYDVAFVADNPGIWMDHCHNLEHAADGLVTHLMYEGVTEPYRIGEDSGNEPE